MKIIPVSVRPAQGAHPQYRAQGHGCACYLTSHLVTAPDQHQCPAVAGDEDAGEGDELAAIRPAIYLVFAY
jgi:hypothetical protein